MDMNIVEKTNATLIRIEQNDPKLKSLSVVNQDHSAGDTTTRYFWLHNGADLRRLGNAIANNTQIQGITFHKSSDWTGDTASLLEGLKRNTTINRLYLHGSIGIDILNKCVANISLVRICMMNCDLREGIAGSIAPVMKMCPTLNDICIIRCKLDDVGLKAFATGIRGSSTLQKLNLNHTNAVVTDDYRGNIDGNEGAEAIAALLQDPNCGLTELKLSNIGFSNDSIQQIVNGLKDNTTVKCLSLSSNKIERSGCESIIYLMQSPGCGITSLDLGRCGINNESAAKIVRSLAGNTKLEHLDLAGNDIGRPGCESIVRLLQDPSCNINSLDLGSCGLQNDLTTKLVSSLIGNTKMAKLGLSDNSIGRSGCESIATLLRDSNSNIESISLFWNNLGTRQPSDDNVINDDCAIILAQALVGNNKLTCLDLGQSSITKSGWNAFITILSSCSNTTLCSLGEAFGIADLLSKSIPSDLTSLLKLNLAVDMEPLFELDSEDDERKPKALPSVIDWFDRRVRESNEDGKVVKSIRTRKLSAIFQFARAMPLSFVATPFDVEGKKKKRKRRKKHYS